MLQTSRSRRAQTRPRSAALCVSIACLLATTSALATSHPVSAAKDTPTLVLIDQTPNIRLGVSDFRLKLRIANANANDSIYVEVFKPVTSHQSLRNAITQGQLPAPNDSKLVVKVADLVTDSDRNTTVNVALQLEANKPRLDTLRIREPGVYPLRVSLQPRSQLQDEDPRFLTWLTVYDPKNPPRPVSVAQLWRIPPGDFSTAAATETSRRVLNNNARVLRSITGPMSVVVNATTLVSWRAASTSESDATTFQQFVRDLSSDTRSILNAPYATIDPHQFLNTNLVAVHRETVATGASILTDDFKLPIVATSSFVAAATEQSLHDLELQGIETVIVSSDALATLDSSLEFQKFRIRSTQLQALSTSKSPSAQLFASVGSATERSQQFGAWLALLSRDHPGSTVVLDIPVDAMTNPTTLRALQRILSIRNPFVNNVTTSTALRRSTQGTDTQGRPLVRSLSKLPPSAPKADLERAQALRVRLNGYAQLVGDDKEISGAKRAFLDALAFNNSSAQASYHLDRVQSLVESLNQSVSVSNQTITLTSQRSEVPFTFTNTSGRALRVRVQLTSPRIKQTRPNETFDLPAAPRNQTHLIQLEVNGSGEFPVDVTVSSPDGAVSIATSRITMNSTVFGAFGSWLTYGAIAFLAAWWIHHGWRKHRAKRRPARDALTATIGQ